MLSQIFWNPDPVAFQIPFIEHPIAWYGVLFATGFFLAYLVFIPLMQTLFSEAVKLYERDVENWLFLRVELLKHREIVFQNIGRKHEVRDVNEKRVDLIEHLNQMFRFTRKEWLEKLPNSLIPASRLSAVFTDHLLWFMVVGTVIGARLGHVLFYDFHYYTSNPEKILFVWEGGLASHGAAFGIFIALFLFLKLERKQYPDISYLKLLDALSVAACVAATCIRLGNFINQEIVGTVTNMPWAITFLQPQNGLAPLPRHPTQLYEAIVSFVLFFILRIVWKQTHVLKEGFTAGLFFVVIFASRFFLEFFKADQGGISTSLFSAGQLLSIPFVLFGFFLIKNSYKNDSIIKCSYHVN